MPEKVTILNGARLEYFAQAHKLLRGAALKPYLTKTQADEIAHRLDETVGYPTFVTLDQRSPKGTVYVYAGPDPVFQIDQRGGFQKIYPRQT